TRTNGEAGAELLAEATAAYRAALRIRTEAEHPVEWAMTQNSLAIALANQGTRTNGEAGAELLAEAIAAFRAALRIFTEAEHPMQWAETQENMAITEQGIAKHDTTSNPRPHLNAALTHVDNALKIFDPTHMPYNHGTATTLRSKILAELAALDEA
ncbi:MAG: hypothetical protein WBC85_00425, partial [Planktotalea sp.]|uniref:hypothetical protein n=1 Tax=Planktotalea sp. TaxID=2029877 RepID=UPI003C75AF25